MRRSLLAANEPHTAFALFDNPIWRREWRTRWRDGRAMLLVFALVAAFSFLLVRRYAGAEQAFEQVDVRTQAAHQFAEVFWRMVAWGGTLVALVVAPSLSASAIAFERERGLLEGLQLAPLRPIQIILGKWLSSLAYILLLWLTVLPILLLLFLMGVSPAQFLGVLAWQGLTLAFASALGIACSAWAHRAHFALRTTYGFILLWVLSSYAAAYVAGETAFPAPLGWSPTFVSTWWGRVNPILASLDIVSPLTSFPKWILAGPFMMVLSGLCLWVATVAVKRPLDQTPFIEKSAKTSPTSGDETTPKKRDASVPSHMVVPLVGEIYFQNPVLGRELRGKFRMRQPPLAVILTEIVLGIVVTGFYIYVFYLSLSDPLKRGTVFYGVAITVTIVTVLSCGIMGSNGFSREREGGTWEGVQLSLLSARQIVWGKLCGSLLTCVLFSFPVWPLLCVGIRWGGAWVLPLIPSNDAVAPAQLITALLVWGGSMPFFTLLGLWLGRRKTRSSLAAGITLSSELGLLLVLPLILFMLADARNWGWLMGTTNPLVVLLMSAGPEPQIWVWGTGIPYFFCSLLLSALLWVLVVTDVEREIARKEVTRGRTTF